MEGRIIKVVETTGEDFLEFETNWFIEGDFLQDVNDPEHDIELEGRIGSSGVIFKYKGTAKVGEEYQRVIINKA